MIDHELVVRIYRREDVNKQQNAVIYDFVYVAEEFMLMKKIRRLI